MLRPGLIALLCALTVGAVALVLPAAGGAAAVAPHSASAITIADLPRPEAPRVILAFLPARERPPKVPPTVSNPPNPQEIVQKRIDLRRQLSLGLVGATQGPYTQEQFLLDLSAAAQPGRRRAARSAVEAPRAQGARHGRAGAPGREGAAAAPHGPGR